MARHLIMPLMIYRLHSLAVTSLWTQIGFHRWWRITIGTNKIVLFPTQKHRCTSKRNATRDLPPIWCKLNHFLSFFLTLLGSKSEWPKDQPVLLMHSRHARNLYDPKIKRIFEIAWTLFEIILLITFIHLNKHLDGAKNTLWKKL